MKRAAWRHRGARRGSPRPAARDRGDGHGPLRAALHRRLRPALLGALVAGAALLGGCGGGDEPVPIEHRELAAGDYRVVVDTRPGLALLHGEQTLLDFGPDGLELGVADQVDDAHNYDPYWLAVESPNYQPPEGFGWRVPLSGRLTGGGGGDTVGLALDYGDGLGASLQVEALADGRFAVHWQPSGERTAFMRLRPRAHADEGFYGLGEQFDAVDQRGRVRAMQLEPNGETESALNDAHVPVPLLIGTRGWGLFVDTPRPGVFAVAASDERTIEAAFGTGLGSPQGLDFYLFGAARALDITGHYYAVTGAPGLPARWALGPVIWRDENDDQAQVESDLDTIRDLDLATTGYWIDRPYATAVNTFDFEAARFPDPPAMYAKLAALGFGTALWHTPYLDEQASATAALVAEAEAAGYYPPQTAISFNKWGRPIDLTNPAAVSWWQGQLGAYLALGVGGFKLDYGEDVVTGPFDERTAWRFSDGSTEQTMHSALQLAYHAAYAALFEPGQAFLLCRSGTIGDQQKGTVIWPGDLDATMAKRGASMTDGGKSYHATGGLPASVIAGLSLGPSGFPLYGSDTGGYRHCPPDKETFSRWFEQTALSPVMQVGTSCNDVAWESTPANGFDQELLDSYRSYARLHLRLWPYLWSHLLALRDHGRPIARALGLAYPELGIHPDDIYLLGDDLLVAPVLTRGATSRTVSFPPGRWVHWFTAEIFDGPGEAEVAAPLGRLPLFLRQGGLVPMLRPSIDTLLPTTDPARVDSYATDPGLLYVRAVAGGSGSFALFDGGSIEQQTSGSTTTLAASSGSELAAGAMFELLGASAPAAVSIGGSDMPASADLPALEAAPQGWLYQGGVLWVKLPAGSASATITS